MQHSILFLQRRPAWLLPSHSHHMVKDCCPFCAKPLHKASLIYCLDFNLNCMQTFFQEIFFESSLLQTFTFVQGPVSHNWRVYNAKLTNLYLHSEHIVSNPIGSHQTILNTQQLLTWVELYFFLSKKETFWQDFGFEHIKALGNDPEA